MSAPCSFYAQTGVARVQGVKDAPELAVKWIFSAKKTISKLKFCPARERMRARLLVPGDGPTRDR